MDLKCSLCGQMVSFLSVGEHVCKTKTTLQGSTMASAASGHSSPLLAGASAESAVALPVEEALEEELRACYEGAVVMEETTRQDAPSSLPQDATLFQLARASSGERIGFVAKQGATFHLYDSSALLLRSVKGRLVEKKEAIVSDLQEEEGLSLLCTVCLGRVPVDQVEKHAKVCAISFPVQILRFAHSVEAEPAPGAAAAAAAAAAAKKPKKKEGETEIAVLEDFPVTVLTALDKSGVPREMYAKHLEVLVNVLNFASKMKFRLSDDCPTPMRDAATRVLKSEMQPEALRELCKVAHSHANPAALALAKQAAAALEDGIAIIRGERKKSTASVNAEAAVSPETEGQRILAAQKEVFNQASRLYDEVTERQMRKTYSMSKKIGEGGYGKVYVAHCKDKKMQPTEVAIKIMQHDSLDAKARRTNLRELLYLTRLRHPNIVQLHRAHLVEQSSLWLVLEYMEGGTLREASKVHVFDEDEVAFTAFEVLKGVAFMHAQGCVHRDIKSHNVMLTVTGEVKLIDLGLVADVKNGISTMRGILGTTYWIPPEMIRGEKHSYAADVWSTGICLLELCHGYPPNRDNKLRALFLAGAGVAPTLEDANKWSELCHNFFGVCLVPEQTERATAQALLDHRWLGTRCGLPKITRRLREIFMNTALSSAGFF